MTAVRIPSTGDAEDMGYERERQRKLDDESEAVFQSPRTSVNNPAEQVLESTDRRRWIGGGDAGIQL